VHIRIRKDIPVAGGMAGGSADAAAALVACDHLWGLGMTREELEEVAAELGSDVPFLLAGGTAMGSGRGEVLAPVLARGTFHWVFALSEGGLSTPAVYAECDRLRAGADVPEPTPSTGMMTALRSGDPRALGRALVNDLQPASISLMPELGDVLQAGLEFGALGGVVSGSGPTVAFLVGGTEAALDLAVSLTASGTVRDVRRATGPAHGAHLVAGPRPD
jgi:4-diphosphocytidyl-2-C-methyl-D-erythritol kinase